MFKHIIAPAFVLALLVVPASAAPYCIDQRPGLSVETEFGFGGKSRATQQREIDRQRLRRVGVDTNRVERWNGCLRAFVRSPDGGRIMQYFDPNTLQQVF